MSPMKDGLPNSAAPASFSTRLVACLRVPRVVLTLVLFFVFISSPETVAYPQQQQQQQQPQQHQRHQGIDSGPPCGKPVPVLYESDRILIVNKPHGVSHHHERNDCDEGGGGGGAVGILHLLRHERRRRQQEPGMAEQPGQRDERLWGVHRLDKVTSGILVLAKDAEMASLLSQHFARGEIQKVYFGLSARKPTKKKQGWVQGGMERSRDRGWKLVVAKNRDEAGSTGGAQAPRMDRHPNFARTRFFTARIAGGTGGALAGGGTVAMLRPYTGKTHQLRVAAKAMGIPLLGDPIYRDGSTGGGTGAAGAAIFLDGTSDDDSADHGARMSTRTMLHASGIHIPATKGSDGRMEEAVNVWCPPPFFEELRGTADGDSLADRLGVTVRQLMIKNCDVPGIVEAMIRDEQEEKSVTLREQQVP